MWGPSGMVIICSGGCGVSRKLAPPWVATNLPFSEWFPDPRLIAVIVDRVTLNAQILETGTRSCRLARIFHGGARDHGAAMSCC